MEINGQFPGCTRFRFCIDFTPNRRKGLQLHLKNYSYCTSTSCWPAGIQYRGEGWWPRSDSWWLAAAWGNACPSRPMSRSDGSCWTGVLYRRKLQLTWSYIQETPVDVELYEGVSWWPGLNTSYSCRLGTKYNWNLLTLSNIKVQGADLKLYSGESCWSEAIFRRKLLIWSYIQAKAADLKLYSGESCWFEAIFRWKLLIWNYTLAKAADLKLYSGESCWSEAIFRRKLLSWQLCKVTAADLELNTAAPDNWIYIRMTAAELELFASDNYIPSWL